MGEVDGRLVGVAAHLHALMTESAYAGIVSVGGDDVLLKESQRLGWLERGAGRIGAQKGAVEQRVRLVAEQAAHVVAPLLSFQTAGVVGGR